MAKKQTIKPGRKPTDGAEGLKRHNVMLDDATLVKAAEIGRGSVSVGIRKAVKEHKGKADE